MTKLEILEQQIYESGVPVLQYDFGHLPLKGLWFDGVIMISPEVTNSAEKRYVLTEEYCHHMYSTGNILLDAKQEAIARHRAYEMIVPLDGLVDAEKAGCCTTYEIAEHLEVTEEVLVSALDHYRAKGVI